MANMPVRSVPEEVHNHLRAQAMSNKSSVEAEGRAFLVHSYVATHAGRCGLPQAARLSLRVVGRCPDRRLQARTYRPGRKTGGRKRS